MTCGELLYEKSFFMAEIDCLQELCKVSNSVWQRGMLYEGKLDCSSVEDREVHDKSNA